MVNWSKGRNAGAVLSITVNNWVAVTGVPTLPQASVAVAVNVRSTVYDPSGWPSAALQE